MGSVAQPNVNGRTRPTLVSWREDLPVEMLFGFLGATILGAAGWWVGARVGFMTGFIVSTIASGVGLYFGRRFVRDYLG